ncbi:MAG TPA: hypothetical protein VNW71_09235 [Thermoanaerobaculia bacterium]|nr:hypothetical protein [Thermoanaerobaculia bacterium]
MKHPTEQKTRRPGTLAAGLAVLMITGGLAAWSAEPKPVKPVKKTAAVPAASLAANLKEREARYLELGIEQIRRMEVKRGGLGPEFQQNLAAGALASAALAAEGAAEGKADAAKRREDAVRWAAAAIDSCSKRWQNGKCARAQLPLQRLVLQYPDALPAELRDRLRTEVSAAAPPPNEDAVRDPWSFKETENQRMVTMARSLVAHTVAGTPQSPGAKGWGAYAEAFLLAHDREGWYEGESPGYMVLSIMALLQMADHAPQPETRGLAQRQLDLIFAAWAQEQVGGYPAGPKSRTYSFWALSDRSTPWPAWTWMLSGLGNPEGMNFIDRPELAVSRYEVPESVVKLLSERRRQTPYEVKERRRIALGKRKDLDTSLYSYATPDYILGTAQSVSGMSLAVSGGQEIVATLYAEGPQFAPLYLWSRTRNTQEDRWRSWMGQDQAVGHRNVVLARLGAGEALGHAYLSPAWSQPEVLGEAGDILASRYGDTYVALVSPGGWEVAAAQERFPDYYGQSRLLKGSWVAVPRRQPATVALEVGRRAEHGEFEAWKKKVASSARLSGTAAEGAELRFAASDGTQLSFVPGQRASAAGRALEPQSYPLLEAPFLSSPGPGRWKFTFGQFSQDFERLEPGSKIPTRPAT